MWVVLIFLTGKVLVSLSAGGGCVESREGSGPVMGVIWDALGAVIGFLWDGLSTCALEIDNTNDHISQRVARNACSYHLMT